MKIKIQILFLFLSIFSIIGCFDILRETEQKIVGDISVINPDNQEDKGYRMVIYETNYNSNILNEYVVCLDGNDSVLLVKGVDKVKCSDVFYKVTHNKGKQPLVVLQVSANDYTSLLEATQLSYHFKDVTLECP